MPSLCPTEAELTELLTGDPPEEKRTALEHHLETCTACRQRLDLLAVGDGNWLGGARAYAKTPAPVRTRVVPDRSGTQRRSTLEIKPALSDPLLSSGGGIRRMGDYEILGELGRGGMGVVFKARQQSLQRNVALKVILAGQLASDNQVRRFRVEAEAAARLDHPQIVPIYEIGVYEGHHFFSMKLIEGACLRGKIERFQVQKPGSSSRDALEQQRKLARLMADVARAVQHAHERGVLHRDLKPANILLDAQDRPHLTDFGLAKLAESDSDLTRSRLVMGTPEYMAPEQAAGRAREITTASDVYSLGVILYELLTGRPPFEDEDTMRLLARTQNEEPAAPRNLNPAIARDLEIICLKCLEKEPSRRHRSAEALAEELERFACGEAIRSRPVSAPERVWRWCRRKPALAASFGGLFLVFVLGFAGTLWGWRGEAKQARVAEAASRKARQAVTRLEIEQAEAQFHDGNSDKGLAQLARLVRQSPTNHVAVERLMNALTYRTFCLPVAPLTHGSPLGTNQNSPRPDAILSGGSGRVLNVTASSFSPDGRLLVTASLDGTARIWDVATGQPVGDALKHDGPVLWAQFSPDGTTLVTASADGTARIWNLQSRQFIETIPKHQGPVTHACFDRTGRRIMTASADRTARIWDAATGQPLSAPFKHNGPVYFAAFVPDDRHVVTAEFTRNGPPAHLWDLDTKIGTPLPHHGREEMRNPFPCLSPSGNAVLVFNQANGFLFSIPDRRNSPPRPLHHDDDVMALGFSPDGRFAATGSRDSTVRIWNTTNWQAPMQTITHKQAVNSVQFSADGEQLLTGSSDRTAQIWNVAQAAAVTEPLRHASMVLNALFVSNRIVTISEADGAWLWNIPAGPSPVVSWHDRRRVDFARFSLDGDVVISLGQSGVLLLDAHTARPLREPLTPPRRTRVLPNVPQEAEQSPQDILDIDLSPPDSSRRRLLATALESGNTLLWAPFDLNATRPVRRPFGADDDGAAGPKAIRCVRFNSEGTCLLTASDDGTARLWGIDSHVEMFPALRHRNRVNHAEFSLDGKFIVTASWDHTARVWDARTGQPLTPPLPHRAEVNWARFDPSGTRVATASRDKTVCLWSVQTGERLALFQHASALGESRPFDFNSNGTRLATVAGDSLQVWDAISGRSVLGPLQQNALLLSVRFAPDGRRIVTAAGDGEVRVWDLQEGHPLSEPLKHSRRATYAEFSPDGRRIVSSSWDDQVRIWSVVDAPMPPPEWLPNLAEALAGQRLDQDDVSEVVAVRTLFELRQALKSARKQDYYGRWLQWFFNDRQSQATPSFSNVGGVE